MSYEWDFSSNSTPGANNYNNNNNNNHNNTNNVNNDNLSILFKQFNDQLSDHGTKHSALIQNFLASQCTYQKVTNSFFTTINDKLKAQNDYHQRQKKSLLDEINLLKTQIESYKTQIARQEKEKNDNVRAILNFCDKHLSPTEFEYFCGAILESLGYSVQHCGKTHDGGIDLLIRDPTNGFGCVQVKQYRHNTKVSEPQMRDLYGAMTAKDADFGIMIVLSDCTKEAKSWPQRENVKNLKIWTSFELFNILKEKSNNTLLNFIKFIMNKHKKDIKNINNIFCTPKNTKNNNYISNSQHNNHYFSQPSSSTNKNRRNRGYPSANLSSAKRKNKKNNNNLLFNNNKNSNNNNSQSDKDTNDMNVLAKSWNGFKFSGSGLGQLQTKENDNNNQVKCSENVKSELKQNKSLNYQSPKKFILNDNKNILNNNNEKGEPSPISSTDSSLLIDEMNDSDDERNNNINNLKKTRNLNNNNNVFDDFNKINSHFSSIDYNNNNNDNNNILSGDITTNFLYCLGGNNNINKRKKRRNWTEKDDEILMSSLKQYGEQWSIIFDNCTFSNNWTAKEIKKHFTRVLKPKLQKIFVQQQSQQTSQSQQL